MQNKETARKFRRGCAILIDAPDGYEWGKESLDGADCSGVVCHGLICAGFNIRCTAHEIFNKLSLPIEEYYIYNCSKNRILVAVVLEAVNNHPYKKINGIKYRCTHIAPIIGNCILLDANYKDNTIEPITIIDWKSKYSKKDNVILYRELHIPSLEAFSNVLYYGVDELLKLEGLSYDRI